MASRIKICANGWDLIPENLDKNYKKCWKPNPNIKKDVYIGTKKICIYSKEDVKFATKENHPKHISDLGFCVICGNLK